MQRLKKTKKNSDFFMHFTNLDQILSISKKKMTFKYKIFPKIRTAKNVLR